MPGEDDFDRSFLPLRRDLAERWKRIDRMVHNLEELAPVILYGVGGAYYVLDGHFRVSVLRYHGAEHVRAEVTEVRRHPDGWRVHGARHLLKVELGGWVFEETA